MTPEEGHFRSGVPPRCHAVSGLKGPSSKPPRGRSTGHEGCRDQRTPDRRSAPNCRLSRGDQPPPVQWRMAREHRLWSESRDALRREFLCSTTALRWMVAWMVLAVSDPAGTSWVPREIVGVARCPSSLGWRCRPANQAPATVEALTTSTNTRKTVPRSTSISHGQKRTISCTAAQPRITPKARPPTAPRNRCNVHPCHRGWYGGTVRPFRLLGGPKLLRSHVCLSGVLDWLQRATDPIAEQGSLPEWSGQGWT